MTMSAMHKYGACEPRTARGKERKQTRWWRQSCSEAKHRGEERAVQTGEAEQKPNTINKMLETNYRPMSNLPFSPKSLETSV